MLSAASILEGVKVVEACQMVAGPFCTKLLADLGADVVKVEPPLAGDSSRHVGPFLRDEPDQEGSLLFFYVNTGKRGITLDVGHPMGREILRKLVAHADLFVEDYPPKTAETLGLSFDSLSKDNPRLVMVSITPFGRTGPYRDYKAYPLNTFHAGGEGRLSPAGSAFLDRPPLKHGTYVGEYEAAIMAAVPALAAVFHAKATGFGQHVDVSKQEALIALNYAEFQPFINGGEMPRRETRATKIGGLVPCKDGHVVICVHTDLQWQGLIKLIGSPAWASEEWFKDPVKRAQRADEINAFIAAWARHFSRQEICKRGQDYGCPVGANRTVAEVAASEQLRVRRFFADVQHPRAGAIRCPTVPYRFAGVSNQTAPSPTLGQHNEEIYSALGYNLEQLTCLREQRII